MSTKITQDYIEEMIGKLKFIAKIEANEKVNVTYLSKSKDGLYLSVTRMITGENRTQTYDFLSKTINDSLTACYFCINSNDELFRNLGQIILECLELLEGGINNLIRTTYASDAMFTSKLEALLISLKQKIIVIKDYEIRSFEPLINKNEK